MKYLFHLRHILVCGGGGGGGGGGGVGAFFSIPFFFSLYLSGGSSNMTEILLTETLNLNPSLIQFKFWNG